MDTSTRYLGLRLQHPFMVGASPMGARLDTVRRLEDAGASAIVLHSLFEEQITEAQSGRIHGMDPTSSQFAAQTGVFPPPGDYPFAPDEYVEHLRAVKQAVRIPIIASLNGTTAHAWLQHAQVLEQAGADALEVNFYQVIADLDAPGTAVEMQLFDAAVNLKRLLRIPIAIKLSPFYTAFGNVARRLDAAGVDALVIFNRFYQPDIDTRAVTAAPTLELSKNAELLLRLRWLAILHGRVRASLALTGGVEAPNDGLKAILAGAHAVHMVSAILRHGPGILASMVEALSNWMEFHHVSSVDEMRGRVSLGNVPDPGDFERANYIHALHHWSR